MLAGSDNADGDCGHAALFISEVGEGGSNNKWVELYNPTGAASHGLQSHSDAASCSPLVVLKLNDSMAPHDGQAPPSPWRATRSLCTRTASPTSRTGARRHYNRVIISA
jgi:hypothetical protein